MANAVGLLAGYALDRLLGDPRRWHPVAGFGQAAGALERRLYRPDRTAGTAFTALAVGGPVLLGVVAAAATRHRPVARAVLVAAGTWTVLGGRTLRREATVMGRTLRDGDLPAARRRLGHLCGRDPSTLDESELARATVESVAENTSDAVVAPLFWGAVAGLPGLLGYRAANTLDAMVGHRSARYARFGTPAARLDDAAQPGAVPADRAAHHRRRAGRARRTGERRLAGVAAGPQRPPEPQRRPVRGGDGRCARRPARRSQRLLRALRGPARSSATAPAPRRGTSSGPPGSPARSGWPPSGWPPRTR